MAKPKKIKTLIDPIFLILEKKDAGGMGDESPIDVLFGDLSPKRGRRLKVKKRKTNLYFFNAHAVKLATLT